MQRSRIVGTGSYLPEKVLTKGETFYEAPNQLHAVSRNASTTEPAKVLVVGIAFHDPRRDPWVVGGVVLAAVAARAARHWSRPRGSRARPLPWA